MINSRLTVAFGGTTLCLAGFASAGVPNPIPTIAPTSYAMANGDGQASGGGFNYWDDTYNGVGNRNLDRSPLSGGLGQLTDGVLGSDNWAADLGNGPAQEWVGWQNFNPSITFTFAQPAQFSVIGVHANNFNTGGVAIFESFTASFSDDGITFTNPLTRTITPAERANNAANVYALVTGGISARYVRLDFTSASTWTFISEVGFAGTIPAPSAAAMLALAGVAYTRRRR